MSLLCIEEKHVINTWWKGIIQDEIVVSISLRIISLYSFNRWWRFRLVSSAVRPFSQTLRSDVRRVGPVRMKRIDSGQSIWSDSKLIIVKKAKSSGPSEVAFRGRRWGVEKKRETHVFFGPPLQTFRKIKQSTERNYHNIWCQLSSKPYRKMRAR